MAYKMGVSSYSFIKKVQSGDMCQIDVISTAKAMGFEAIEFIDFILEEGETREQFALRAKTESEKYEIEIVAYTIGADFILGSDGNLDAEIARVKQQVDIAVMLSAPVMRHDVIYSNTQSFEAVLPRLIKGCRAVTEYAESQGIKTMVENHGYFCGDSERVEQLVNGVHHPNFKVLLDIGNFACVDEDSAKAVGRLLPYTAHIHVKDFHIKDGSLTHPGVGWFGSRGGNYLRGAIIGHGDIPVEKCMKLIKAYGYEGVVSIEFEGMEECVEGITGLAWIT